MNTLLYSKDPQNLTAQQELFRSYFVARQWVNARQHYDSILQTFSLDQINSQTSNFDGTLGIRGRHFLAYENRLRFIGEELLKIAKAKASIGEELDYEKVAEAFILNPDIADKTLLEKTISFYHQKIGASHYLEFDYSIEAWNQHEMLILMHLYFIARDDEPAVHISMAALDFIDYIENPMQEAYILSIFDRIRELQEN